MREDERKIGKRLIEAALDAGYYVEVWDEEELSLSSTRDKKELLANLGASDLQQYVMIDGEGKNRGAVTLVFGNEPGVLIADNSVVLTQFLKPVEAYQEKFAS